MDPLSQYAGVFFLALLVIATTVLWLRDRIRTQNDPPGRERATRRAWVFLLCASPPWIAMTLGNVIGGLHNPMDFLNFQNGPFAVLFMASTVWVWLALLYWLLAKGGAEEMAESGHMGFVGPTVSDPARVKMFFITCVAAGLCVLVWYIIKR